jgi:hypothetical protein
MAQHVTDFYKYSSLNTTRGVRSGSKGPALDFPANGKCSQQDNAVHGSCCQQLDFIHMYMLLGFSWDLNHPSCSLECALRCGFQHVPSASTSRRELWCVLPLPEFAFAPARMYPLWVKQQYLLKHSRLSSGTGGNAATAQAGDATSVNMKQKCALC